MNSDSNELTIQESDLNKFFNDFGAIYNNSSNERNTYPHILKSDNLSMINLLKSCKKLGSDISIELPELLIKNHNDIQDYKNLNWKKNNNLNPNDNPNTSWERGFKFDKNFKNDIKKDKYKNINKQRIKHLHNPDSFWNRKKNNVDPNKEIIILNLNIINYAQYQNCFTTIMNIEFDENLIDLLSTEIIQRIKVAVDPLIFANLCYDIYNKINKKEEFRINLVNKCQDLFKNNIKERLNNIDKLHPDLNDDCKSSYKVEEINIYKKHVNFIGHLVVKDLISMNIPFMIITDLPHQKDKDYIKYFVQSFLEFFKIAKDKMFEVIKKMCEITLDDSDNFAEQKKRTLNEYKKKIISFETKCNLILENNNIDFDTRFNLQKILLLIDKEKYKHYYLLNTKDFSESIINLSNEYCKTNILNVEKLKKLLDDNYLDNLTDDLMFNIFNKIMLLKKDEYQDCDFLNFLELIHSKNYISQDLLVNSFKKIIDQMQDHDDNEYLNHIIDFLNYILFEKKYANLSFFFEIESDDTLDEFDYLDKAMNILKILKKFKGYKNVNIEYMKQNNILPLNLDLITSIETKLNLINSNFDELVKEYEFSPNDIKGN